MPGTPTCAVLITSRHPLPTLDADDRVRVGPLPDADGLALLAGLTGRVAAEPDAGAEIVDLCGGLPLAIRVAAGRLASRPDIAVAEYARRLADRSRRLDELQLDDLAVRASIRTSYDALLAGGGQSGQLAARAFRMLGLLQVPDVAPPVVAAMLAEPDVETARTALDRLVDAQLVEPVAGGRYRLHDLVRLVATERALEEDAESDRDEAVTRAITSYTASLWQAMSAIRPNRTKLFDDPPLSGHVTAPAFTKIRAGEWIDLERASLVAVLEQAMTITGGAARLPLWLGDALWESLDSRCDWFAAHRVSYMIGRAAERRNDSELVALALLLRGRSEACLGSYDVAVDCLQQGLGVMRELRNEAGAALILNGLGVVRNWRGEPEAALLSYESALQIASKQKLASLLISVFNNMSVSYISLGKLDRAVAMAGRSATSAGADGDLTLHAAAELNLSAAHCLRGDHALSLRCADQALSLSREAGDRLRMCEELIIRSEANLRSGRPRDAWVDAERAYGMAKIVGYRYALTVAEKQRSKAFSALGYAAVPAPAPDLVQIEQRISMYRDPVIERVVA